MVQVGQDGPGDTAADVGSAGGVLRHRAQFRAEPQQLITAPGILLGQLRKRRRGRFRLVRSSSRGTGAMKRLHQPSTLGFKLHDAAMELLLQSDGVGHREHVKTLHRILLLLEDTAEFPMRLGQ